MFIKAYDALLYANNILLLCSVKEFNRLYLSSITIYSMFPKKKRRNLSFQLIYNNVFVFKQNKHQHSCAVFNMVFTTTSN